MKLTALLVFLIALIPLSSGAQFLHRQGKLIVDGDGNEFVVRSMGLGGWMLQEGYMLGTGDFAGTQHEIRALIEASIGKERTNEFYDAWLANHCRKADIDSLATWGFNAVRPALHYNLFTLPAEQEPVAGQDTWLENGFRMVDDLLTWCKAHNMYVILDLHAAPGGQGKDGNISDYDPKKPSLWESEENQRKTVALWRKLAERYANEKFIGGYDLINETNWNFTGTNVNGCDSSNEKLRELMIRITNAIREVDKNHILFVEGNCWANNMTGLFPPWDDNMAYSFHKYWNGTDVNTVSEFLTNRDRYNVPFWMGESGENSNQWFFETIRMLESQKIGWSWWPLKKIGSVVGPLNVVKTEDYAKLLEIWKNGGNPDPEFCYNTLMKITENLMIENCEYHPDVIDAMFRQQTDDTRRPYARHFIPGVIHAANYDMGRHGITYFDKDIMNTNGDWKSNQGWAYRNDGVDIEESKDDSPDSNGYNVGWIEEGEWMDYSVEIKESGAFSVDFRIAANSSVGKFHLEINGKNITGEQSVSSTGDNQSWKDISVANVVLEKGKTVIRFVADKGGFNFGYMRFSGAQPVGDLPLKVLNGFCSPTGSFISLAVNKRFDVQIAPQEQNFRLKVNGFLSELSSLAYNTGDQSILLLTPKKKLKKSDQVVLSYSPGTLQSVDGKLLETFSNLKINTETIQVHAVPGLVEAEEFAENQGWQQENCSDEGGGFDMGYTDDGDWLTYRVYVEKAGRYSIRYRVASGNSNGGELRLQLLAAGGIITTLHDLPIASTNGWQNWVSLSRELQLPAGEQTLRILVNKREFNLNRMELELLEATSTKNEYAQSSPFVIYPNPAKHRLYVDFQTAKNDSYALNIVDMQGKVLKKSPIGNTGRTEIDLDDMPGGLYLLRISGKTELFCRPFIISN